MASFTGSTFTNATIELDGNTYSGCIIDHCQLIYRGGELPSIVNCAVSNSRFIFSDAALRTLQYLGALRSGGFKDVADGVIKDLESGPTPPEPKDFH